MSGSKSRFYVKAVVCRVITSFGEQEGRHNIIRAFFY